MDKHIASIVTVNYHLNYKTSTFPELVWPSSDTCKASKQKDLVQSASALLSQVSFYGHCVTVTLTSLYGSKHDQVDKKRRQHNKISNSLCYPFLI